MRIASQSLLIVLGLILVAACGGDPSTTVRRVDLAPGEPGAAPFWSDARKTGIGSSYEAYLDGAFSDAASTGTVSRVWFSLAEGMITETMYGLIHEAQIREVGFLVTGGGRLDTETQGMTHTISYLDTDTDGRPLAPAYVIESRPEDDAYLLTRTILTDPDQQALIVRVQFEPRLDGLSLHLMVDPAIANTGTGDRAAASPDALHAWEGDTHLVVRTDAGFAATSAGFKDSSDGLDDLAAHGRLRTLYAATGETPGNVVLTATLAANIAEPVDRLLAIGFGADEAAAAAEAQAALDSGFEDIRARYLGTGDAVGWIDYLAGLDALASLYPISTDNGVLANASALVLKVQEDKTYAGALIASLSNPWGLTTPATASSTGYKAVWPRDFYQVAMAFLALGDPETALTAFRYLHQVQVTDSTPGNSGVGGWFMQKTHVDGEPEWVAVQLDQTAMPIMLGWQLWQAGALSEGEITAQFEAMLRPAADFLVTGGVPDIGYNSEGFEVIPPLTQQERWEEQWGYSPSTTAAVITGLVAAADIAAVAGDASAAQRYLAAADAYEAVLEETMFTTNGSHIGSGGMNGRYFLRITRNQDPDDRALIGLNNGRAGLPEDEILDAGFLELVRYGVRDPLSPSIVDSLPELDSDTLGDMLQVRYSFPTPTGEPVPGWRRYGNDGYGETTLGGYNYAQGGEQRAEQRGRVWPFLTGERGHYQLAVAASDGVVSQSELADLRDTYVRALEHFANEGLMLPEQVWDGVGENPFGYTLGEGTNSATPLAWTHAEYLKLLRSIRDGRVWDHYEILADRYPSNTASPDTDQ